MRRAARIAPARAALAAVLIAVSAIPAAAAECRLALVLALDVSSSVDAREYNLQKEGLASALEDKDVREALLGEGAPVALAVFEWSGAHYPTDVLRWTLLTDAAALDRVAGIIRGAKRSHNDLPTAIGRALGYAATMLDKGPECWRKTVDVSGDGKNNHGYRPAIAYRNFNFVNVTVNGLVVGGGGEAGLVDYYRKHVLHGPEAFLEVAAYYDDFGRAMRRKLLREVKGGLVVGSLR